MNFHSFSISKIISSFLFLTFICSINTSKAQQFIGNKIEEIKETSLKETIKEYDVYSIDALALSNFIHDENYNNELNLKLGDVDLEMYLFEDDIRAHNYKVRTSGTNGMIEQPKERNITYSGFLKNNPNSKIRLTINDHFIFGLFQINDEEFFIEPASYYSQDYHQNSFIFYNVKNVIKNSDAKCGATEVHKISKNQTQNNPNDQPEFAPVECNEVELAILSDYLYYVDKGSSVTNVTNRILAVMNAVNTDYDNPFSERIKFTVVEQIIITAAANDPLSNATFANTVLDEFTAWGNSSTSGVGFTNSFDLGQFWTSRDLDDGMGNNTVVGLAWIGVVCTSTNNYHILEDRYGLASVGYQLRVLTSHEIGHNFNANHDAPGSGFVMAPSVNNTAAWSPLSISVINTRLGSISCLGPYFKILRAQPTNCSGGTYDLEVVVQHDGAGTSLDVAADGFTQNFAIGTSPQSVVLTGLTANGTASTTVTVDEISSSPDDCSAVSTYQEPSSNCIGTIFDETFNNCSSAAHGGQWTVTSGETSSFSYQFGLNTVTQNYSVGNFDGSCYAYLDDDISSNTSFTGTSILTSPIISLVDYGGVSLSFDYNFHNFEEAKPLNNSQFDVEVYDGTAWVNVLSDNTDSPSCFFTNVWSTGNNCLTNSNINLNSYLNADFQVRFIYSDGGTGAWTGMIAIDNITITATTYSGGCTQADYYADTDGDTFGAGAATQFCVGSQPAGYVVDNTDCDDTNPNIYPGATEICDGIDNNCNNFTDEGFDPDLDDIASCFDNCPDDFNPGQEDADMDGVGDACECASGLPNSLTINNNPIPPGIYEAAIDINSAGVAEPLTNPDKIEFKAGNDITLNTNFWAKVGTDFVAQLESCGNPTPLAMKPNEEINVINQKSKLLNTESKSLSELTVYPNPTNGITNIEFNLESNSPASLLIFNTKGELVRTLLEEENVSKGFYKKSIDSKDLPTGIYSILLRLEKQNVVKRMIVIK